MRILALDIGDVRIGLAVSDVLGITANPLETYVRKKNDEEGDCRYIADLAKAQGVERFVLGLPINMDGTEGPRVEKTRAFAERLASVCDIPIDYQDERLTTVTAERVLIEQGVRREKRKEVIDKVAATIILRCYLDRRGGFGF